MTRMKAYGTHKIVFTPTIADVSAPTAAECNAIGNLDIGELASREGYTLGVTGQEEINDSAIASEGNDTIGGLLTTGAEFDFYKHIESTEDVAWATFKGGNVPGFIIHRISAKKQEPFEAGDEVEVWKVESNVPRLGIASGNLQKFMVKFSTLTAESDRLAVVAA